MKKLLPLIITGLLFVGVAVAQPINPATLLGKVIINAASSFGLTVNVPDNSVAALFAGATKSVAMVPTNNAGIVRGLDNTGTVLQPLIIDSSNTFFTINGSNVASLNSTAFAPTSDDTVDLGVVGTNRWKDIFISRTAVVQGTLQVANTFFLGSPPTASGTCAVNTQTGGQQAGTFKANGACAGGTVILTFALTTANGYSCSAHDQTTVADLMNQTASTTTTATFTGTMASLDVVNFTCIGF